MSKNQKPTKTFLTLQSIPELVMTHEEVALPEFGEDENGEAFVVYVRPLTVLTNNLLTKYMNTFTINEDGNLDRKVNRDRDEPCIIAALHTYDGDGNLVFGVDYEDAINRVESLPPAYRPAIYRISQSAIEQAKVEKGSKTAVEMARKN